MGRVTLDLNVHGIVPDYQYHRDAWSQRHV